MRIISGTTDFKLNNPTAVAVGKFDGVHLGHRLLIRDIVEYASAHNLESVIFTFEPSPEKLFGISTTGELSTREEKRRILERLGIDILIEFPMNMDTAATEPEVFVSRYLCSQMNAQYIVAGTDLSFGKKGLGNARLLADMAEECGYSYHILDKIMYEGKEISSTLIREAILKGDMEYAASLLGSSYQVQGKVVHGRKLGRTMGMPTANIYIDTDKLVGPNGVYISMVHTGSGDFCATSNIGVKPTFDELSELCCESYLYDFDGDLYDEYIEVELIKFVRPEMRFDSVDALKAQMQRDIDAGWEYHEKNHN